MPVMFPGESDDSQRPGGSENQQSGRTFASGRSLAPIRSPAAVPVYFQPKNRVSAKPIPLLQNANERAPAGHFKFLRVWSVKFLHPARQDMMIVSLTLFPGQGLQRPL